MQALVPNDKPVVVAIGGNSLVRAGQSGTLEEQRTNAEETCATLADLVRGGHRLVVTHGNGPQVGHLMRRVGAPLDVVDSDVQGGIGYMLQQILGDHLAALGLPRRVVTLVTQVIVDPADPAFDLPTKPIGEFFGVEEADRRSRMEGWDVAKVNSRGYRRVVASPPPLEIVEMAAIHTLYDAGFTCICAGGGGVPVIRRGGRLVGCEAVIDKDLASSMLARELGSETLVISTSVPTVLLDFERANERPLAHLTVAEATRHLREGQFPRGSMGPKIRAAIEFLSGGGSRVLITDPAHLSAALLGAGGTWITPGE